MPSPIDQDASGALMGAAPTGASLARLAAPARTNVELYLQCHDSGWDLSALLILRDAYELAVALFADRFRASGKTFLAHAVGTASLLAALGASLDVVAAGLLHAAYDQGKCALAGERARRDRIRRTIGAGAEALIWRYHEFAWNGQSIVAAAARLASLDEIERRILLMRLANELDDNLALEMRYCAPEKDAFRDQRSDLIGLAEALGQKDLAQALAQAYRASDLASWASALSRNRKTSYRLASPLRHWFRTRLKRLAQKLPR